MPLLPIEASRAQVAEELPGAQAWADRRGLKLEVDDDRLTLRVLLQGGPAEAPERYLLDGRFDDYPAVPPIWTFLHPESREEIGAAAFPAAPPMPIGGSSIFIQHADRGAMICAHFNRWAFSINGGPHGDWGELSNWRNANAGQVTATTVGDMLERIAIEVAASQGRMALLS